MLVHPQELIVSCCLYFILCMIYLHFSFIGDLDTLLNLDDAIEIFDEIVDVKDKSENLGLLLELPLALRSSLQQQYSNPEVHLLHIIIEFLKIKEPKPTWRVIIDALTHPLLHYDELAQEIKRKYLFPEVC